MDSGSELEQGREAYARGAWVDADEALTRADREGQLGTDDLELLATAAYMLGRDDDYLDRLERAHRTHLDDDQTLPAARCAFWIGLNLLLRGQMGPASGWLGRAQRLVEREHGDCVEQGYLLVPVAAGQVETGEAEAGYATASDAAAIAERFDDADLLALAVHWQGYARAKQGRVAEGLGLLDEAMVAVTAGETSPIVTGLVYCSVIEACHLVYALRRAHEWTLALTRWCQQQPDLVAFTGRCLIHRAEIMQLHGSWGEALEEAGRAGERLAEGTNQAAAAEAAYRQGEVHRLQGEFGQAESAYRQASRSGREPQPGLALLRLTQHDYDAAAAAIRRALGEATEPLPRAGLLPAYVEIMLAIGDEYEARAGCEELESVSASYESSVLDAMVAHARGAADLAADEASQALVALRRAWQAWQDLEAPYEAARARVLMGLACRSLGDDDTAALELDAARAVFSGLGAGPDVARVDSLMPRTSPEEAHGLTARELQVLRLVAAGKTNKAVAAELVLSDRTVDRHVSNIFSKLRVSSRAAATAYAYEHRLL